MPSIDSNKILVWLTNLLAVSAISFVAYFFVQFREVQMEVVAIKKDVSDLPNLRQREVATEKEISDLRATDNTKLSQDEHLRFRDQMEAQHIENLKATAALQDRISNLPKEFPPPPWFIDQFNELRTESRNNGAKLDDLNVRFARVETALGVPLSSKKN